MNKENENSITPQNSALNLADVMAMLPYESKMQEFITSRSQLYTS